MCFFWKRTRNGKLCLPSIGRDTGMLGSKCHLHRNHTRLGNRNEVHRLNSQSCLSRNWASDCGVRRPDPADSFVHPVPIRLANAPRQGFPVSISVATTCLGHWICSGPLVLELKCPAHPAKLPRPTLILQDHHTVLHCLTSLSESTFSRRERAGPAGHLGRLGATKTVPPLGFVHGLTASRRALSISVQASLSALLGMYDGPAAHKRQGLGPRRTIGPGEWERCDLRRLAAPKVSEAPTEATKLLGGLKPVGSAPGSGN
jgi:hypothetical protein